MCFYVRGIYVPSLMPMLSSTTSYQTLKFPLFYSINQVAVTTCPQEAKMSLQMHLIPTLQLLARMSPQVDNRQSSQVFHLEMQVTTLQFLKPLHFRFDIV